MPSIADSSIDISANAVVSLPVAAPIVGGSSQRVLPLRSLLPSDQVLDTVTAAANASIGAVPVWKSLPTTGNSESSSSSSSSSSSGSSTTPVAAGTPREVFSVVATQTAYKNAANILESLVAVSYNYWHGDPYFAGIQVWFTGYRGSSTPTLMAQGTTSPVAFTCDATGETVVVTVVAFGPSGLTADFSTAPKTTVALTGQVSAPPAPSISQALVALAGGVGWQFSWNTESGLLQNVVAGYWVYKSSTNTTPVAPAGRYRYFTQPPTNIGPMVFQDIDSATEYYWVSSVGPTGLESSLVQAASAPTTASIYPSTNSGAYSSPSSAYDGNEATSSLGTSQVLGQAHGNATTSETWGGFSTYTGSPTAITLKILSDAWYDNESDPGLNVSCNVTLSYSLDSGTTWTPIYNLNSQNVAKQYSSVSLPTTQNLTTVKVQASCSTHSSTQAIQASGVNVSVQHDIYEIRIEVTVPGV